MHCLVTFLFDPTKCLKYTNYIICCYVFHKVSHVTQFSYVFIGPWSSSLTTNSLRMSVSAHKTLVPQKSILSVSAHETWVPWKTIRTSTIFHILTKVCQIGPRHKSDNNFATTLNSIAYCHTRWSKAVVALLNDPTLIFTNAGMNQCKQVFWVRLIPVDPWPSFNAQ